MSTATLKPMSAIFVGHGNPMNIIRRNRWTDGWSALGTKLSRPRAILVVSAHWYIPAAMVTAMQHPRTIYDFGGFPKELYEIKYPVHGDPMLAERVQDLLSPIDVKPDHEWGLDHGAWSILHHMFPKADIPVVQLSIDRRQLPEFHYRMGKVLAPLRDEGVLLLGSGNLVHNIPAYQWDQPDAPIFDWALKFEEKVRDRLHSGKDAELINYQSIGPEARLSVPTPDHYLPLLYILGSRRKSDRISIPIEGFDGGAMSMLALQLST